MTHDTTDHHGEGSMGRRPSQGIFIGWLAMGLLAVMAIFAVLVFVAGSVPH